MPTLSPHVTPILETPVRFFCQKIIASRRARQLFFYSTAGSHDGGISKTVPVFNSQQFVAAPVSQPVILEQNPLAKFQKFFRLRETALRARPSVYDRKIDVSVLFALFPLSWNETPPHCSVNSDEAGACSTMHQDFESRCALIDKMD